MVFKNNRGSVDSLWKSFGNYESLMVDNGEGKKKKGRNIFGIRSAATIVEPKIVDPKIHNANIAYLWDKTLTLKNCIIKDGERKANRLIKMLTEKTLEIENFFKVNHYYVNIEEISLGGALDQGRSGRDKFVKIAHLNEYNQAYEQMRVIAEDLKKNGKENLQ